MPTKKPKSIYRSLFSEAWTITRSRPWLWVFGIFAAFMTTGGLFELGFRSFKRIATGRHFLEQLLQGTLPGYDFVVEYIHLFSQLEPWRQSILLGFFTLGIVAFVGAAVFSQQILLQEAKEKTPVSWRELWHHERAPFWRLLTLNILSKGLVGFLLFLSTLPLVLISFQTTGQTIFFSFSVLLLFFLSILGIGILHILTAINTVHHHTHLFHALHASIQQVKKHWMALLEMGLLLFLVSFVWTIATCFLLAAAGMGVIILLLMAVVLNSPTFYFIIVIGSVLILTVLGLLSGGFLTTFHYAIWVQFHEHLLHEPLVSKLQRVWSKK
jgi:hypothetical protein